MTECKQAVPVGTGERAGIPIDFHDRRRDTRAILPDHHSPGRFAFARHLVEWNPPLAANLGHIASWRRRSRANGSEWIRSAARAAVVLPFETVAIVHNLDRRAVLVERQHQSAVRE